MIHVHEDIIDEFDLRTNANDLIAANDNRILVCVFLRIR
jgi:hypothetical protein